MDAQLTTLEQRQKRYVPGQYTWPNLTSGRFCDACRLFLPSKKNDGSGKCDLVLRRQGFAGAAFKGADAIACSQFDEGVHEDAPKPSTPP